MDAPSGCAGFEASHAEPVVSACFLCAFWLQKLHEIGSKWLISLEKRRATPLALRFFPATVEKSAIKWWKVPFPG
jgi:hypothetical protein